MTEGRWERFSRLFHGVFLILAMILPLLRACWDQWAQTGTLLVWALFTVLGSALVWGGAPGDWGRLWAAARRFGPALGVFFLAGLLSALSSDFPRSVFPALLNDAPALAFFALAAGVSVEKRALYRRALAGAGLVAVGSALLGRSGFLTSPLVGTLLNPNILVSLAALAWPVAWGLGLENPRGSRARRLWMLGAGVLVFGVLVSGSVVGLSVFLVQTVIGALVLGKRGAPWRLLWPWLAGGVVLAGLGLFVFARADVVKIFHGDPDRWTWWMSALRMFADRFFLGVGPGAFGEAYPAYRAADWGLNSLYAHNFFLEVLAERGALGAGAFAVFLWLSLGQARREIVPAGWPGLGLGLGGFFLYSLFHIGFSFPALYWLFFLAAGLAAAPEDGPGPRRPKRWAAAAGTAAILLAGASVALFRSSQCLAQARDSWSRGALVEARELADRGLRWNPWNPELLELRAGLRLRAQDWDGARRDVDRAVALAPASAGFRIDAAELALERGDADEALRQYDAAVRLMPLNPSAWERRGDLLAGRGRRGDARASYDGALRALADPRVWGGDADRRRAASLRVEEKRGRIRHE